MTPKRPRDIFQSIRSKLTELFGIDLRSLALFRIGLGLLIIGDLIFRSFNLRAHYTDFGVLPRTALLENFSEVGHLSLHLINGTTLFQALLFILAAAFAVAVLLGYRTRGAVFFSWLLLISLHSRNGIVLQGGDFLLRMLLFWSLFLPLGACCSIDSALRSAPKEIPDRIVSPGSVALLLQVCFVYWFTAALKTDARWWQEGSAVYYALQIDQMATPLGHYLLNFPRFLRLLTHGTLAWEIVGPILAFFPFFTGPIRTAVVFLFIAFHVAMGASLELGPFPYICIVAWLVFLPTWFWEKISLFRWRPIHRLGERLNQKIAGHRMEGAQWLKERPLSIHASPWQNAIAIFFLVYVFLWNLRTLDFPKFSKIFPRELNFVGEIFRVDQMWNMFSPFPLTDDGWYVIPGKLKDGREIDLFQGGKAVSWEKPDDIAAMYRGERWRKYMMNLWNKENAKHRLYYGRYLCRFWNSRHQGDEVLQNLQIYFMRENTLPNYQTPKIEKVLLWDHQCFQKTNP